MCAQILIYILLIDSHSPKEAKNVISSQPNLKCILSSTLSFPRALLIFSLPGLFAKTVGGCVNSSEVFVVFWVDWLTCMVLREVSRER